MAGSWGCPHEVKGLCQKVNGVTAYYHLDDQALSAVPAIEPHGIQRFHVGQ